MDRVPKWGGAAKAAPSSFIVENGKWKAGGTVWRDRGVGDAAPYENSKVPCRAWPVCPAVGGAVVVGRRHTWVPPYGGTYKVCVGAAAPPDDGHRIFINCHSEERSDVGIRFLLCGSAARGEYGLPRAFHALAMTGLGGAVRVGGGAMWASSYALVGGGGRRDSSHFFHIFSCCKICRKIL